MTWTKHTRGAIGRANTALVSHNNRLLALFEQDVPYAIDPVSLETIGKVLDFGTVPDKRRIFFYILNRVQENLWVLYC